MRSYIDLMESVAYSLLMENEQRAQFIIKNSGHKLDAKYRADVASGQVPEQVRQQIEGPEHEAEVTLAPDKIAHNVVEFIMQADPTPNKVYSQWIAMRYLKPAHNAANPDAPHPAERIEDINPNLSQMLTVYARATASRRINGDINQYKTFDDLYDAVQPFLVGDREVSSNEDRKKGRNTKVDVKVAKQWENDPMLKEANVIYDSDNYMVLQPLTPEAAKHFGENTRWCTTTTMFHHYFNQGRLWIILRRKDARKWQFHFENGELMDEADRAIDINDWMDENPEAVKGIGINEFGKLIGVRLRGPTNMSMRHFSKEVMDGMSPEVLAKTVSSMKDIEALPRDKVDTKEFLATLLRHRLGRYDAPAENEIKRIIAHYVKVFPNDMAMWEDLYRANQSLLKDMPPKYQTDDAKIALASGMWDYKLIGNLVPKPWPEIVEQKYWEYRIREDRYLVASEIPEKFRSPEVLVQALARNPSDLSSFADQLDENLAQKIVTQAILGCVTGRSSREERDFQPVIDVIKHMPKQFLTKKVQLPIYQRAMELKAKKDEDARDQLLKALALFGHDLWPWKAATLSQRMGMIHDDFGTLPKEMHTSYHAQAWARQHPTSLDTIPADLLTEKVIAAALDGVTTPAPVSATDRYGNEKAGKVAGKPYSTYQLEKAVAAVLNPEGTVSPAPANLEVHDVVAALKSVPKALQGWGGLPEKFLTHEIIEACLEKGFIPFGDEHYPVDAYTPQNIAKYFKTSVPVEVEGPKESNRYYGSTVPMTPNVGGMKTAWELIPETSRTKEALIEIIKEGFMQMPRAVPKEMLDSSVLDAWVAAAPNYGHGLTEVFKLFPDTSHTASNMAVAVKKHIVDKVPKHLKQDDEVLMAMMKEHGSKKDVDWKKVTPELFVKFAKRHHYEAGSIATYSLPKNSPILRDPQVALALLNNEKDDSEERNIMGSTDVNTLRNIYGKDASRRAQWTEEQYALAAGNIVKLADIPEKYRSERVQLRAVKTRPQDISEIKNPTEWLDKHGKSIDYSSAIQMLSKGIVPTEKGWEDAKNLPHETVQGAKGSYVVAKLHKGKALMFFDEKGNPLEAMVTHDSNQDRTYSHHYAPRDNALFAADHGPQEHSGYSSSRPDRVTPLAPYRRLIGKALESHPEITKMLPNGWSRGLSQLKRLNIYPKQKDDGEWALLEDFPRKPVTNSDLTYVDIGDYSYGDKNKTFLFDGDKGMVGTISFDSNRGGRVNFEGASLDKVSKRLLELSSGFATFLKDQGCVSGQNPAFKESDLHNKLGIRGPGKGEWWSYLENKVLENGDLTVWRNTNRVAVTDDTHGVIATAKWSKAGGIKLDSITDEALREKVERVLNAVASKF